MGEKDNFTLFVDGKPVGQAKSVKNGLHLNGDEQSFFNMAEKECHTMSFSVEASEDAMSFFQRMADELKQKEDAINERVESLFREFCQLGGEKADEAYDKVLQLFSLGYKLGWNDNSNLNKFRTEYKNMLDENDRI